MADARWHDANVKQLEAALAEQSPAAPEEPLTEAQLQTLADHPIFGRVPTDSHWFPLSRSDTSKPTLFAQAVAEIRRLRARLALAAGTTAPQCPPGFVLVPLEPTPEMLAASWTKAEPRFIFTDHEEHIAEAYRAMLAARPSPTSSAPAAAEQLSEAHKVTTDSSILTCPFCERTVHFTTKGERMSVENPLNTALNNPLEHERILREALKEGKDAHQAVADWAGVPRQFAKQMNYYLLYRTAEPVKGVFDGN